MTGEHVEKMTEIYGGHGRCRARCSTASRCTGRGRSSNGSRRWSPSPPLYPSDAVREAERWGDDELQDLGRRLPWGALHFRPEAMGTFGGGPLDPAGTDYAMRFARASWKYHKISCARLAEDLAALPEKVDRIAGWLDDGTLGGATPNAADLQIGATIRVLLILGDVRPALAPGRGVGAALFPDYAGDVPAGAFPAGWI